MDLAAEKGSSSWSTTLPIKECGFSLHKGAFGDAVWLRYGWIPNNLATHCFDQNPKMHPKFKNK